MQKKVHQSFHDHPPLEANSNCEDVWTNFIVHLQTSIDQLQKYVIDQLCVTNTLKEYCMCDSMLKSESEITKRVIFSLVPPLKS